MTSEFFEDKPPQPKLSGMSRARGRRGTSGLSALIAQPSSDPAPETGPETGSRTELPPSTPPVDQPKSSQAALVAAAPPVAPAPEVVVPEAPRQVSPPRAESSARTAVEIEAPKPEVPSTPRVEPTPRVLDQEAEQHQEREAAASRPDDHGAPPDTLSEPDPPSAQVPAKARRQASRAAQPGARRSPAPKAVVAESSAYQTPEQISIYVTPSAKERARAMSRIEGIEYAQLAMDAIDHFLGEGMLSFLVRARLEVSRPNGSHFPPRRNLRSRSKTGVRRVLWPVQFRPAELDVLNSLVSETGAEHLSTLVSVAVEAYLLDDDDPAPSARSLANDAVLPRGN
ncbi:hypothetical protein [Nonomuraea diastatica]|uniref:Uncharacterized protein n=1 Tax=Nonomuraea diastatica TaxID=1848329 RepID=A0A4R4W513_9ACTN|nr:hypothetical protein [Nonomuraea diastatica]TDD13021.1 hypothetical protein E1294_42540 [Nonomuraea diastatica]